MKSNQIISVFQSGNKACVIVRQTRQGGCNPGRYYFPGELSLKRLGLVLMRLGSGCRIHPFLAGVGYVAKVSGRERNDRL